MTQLFLVKLPGWLIPAVVGAVLISSVPVYLFLRRSPQPPPALVLFACRNIAPGMRRVDSYGFGIQFDVSEKDFTFRSWMGDMTPGRTYVVTLKERNANMQISDIPLTFEEELTSAFPVLSEHVGGSDVLSPQGQVVGKDR
jgi:hypothetical protein